jgi:signal peptidase I
VLRPALDALAPEETAAAARRVRNAAIALAFAAWLQPDVRALGTDTIERRAAICAAFAACAVAAHLFSQDRSPRAAFAAAVLVPGAVVFWAGAGAAWGFGFVAFAAVVLAATEARRRFVVAPALPAEFDPLPPQSGGPPAVLNWLAWFALSVLLAIHFAWQATVVPTGSMQPTIMGAAGRGGTSGDHLLVERFSYLFRDPRRWDIAVFEYPLFRERLFVKRVVGLPGERVEIKDGDVWVNGAVAKKPPLVQHALWVELFPRASRLAKARAINDGFQAAVGGGGSWKRVSSTEMRCAPGAKGASLALFNGGGPYADTRIVFTAVAESGAEIVARITSRGTPVTLSAPAAAPGTSARGAFFVGPEEHDSGPRQGEFSHCPTVGEPCRIELCVADGEAWALVDGREVARAAVPRDERGKNRIEIGAQGAPVDFKDVWVGHDIEYVSKGTAGAWDVPADGFFFVGDNQETAQGRPASHDGRSWSVDVFHPSGGGAPIAAATEVPDESGATMGGRIRVEDGRYRFLDVDGTPRDLPVEGTRRERGVPWPFVRRNHLVGRAFMIIWPFNTPDAGFRPRLLP